MSGMESAPGAKILLDGKRYLYFGGTGYFGLHGHPEVIRAGIAAYKKYGTHSATSRAGLGNNPVLLEVENRLEDFFGTEAAVYFGSGYLSCLVLAQSLAGRYDAVFVDSLAHFCINDAAPSLQKPVYIFRHRDPGHLRKMLKVRLRARQRPLVLTDGVFPLFGKIAPLPEYTEIVSDFAGIIGLDDAHGVGVLGARGRGTVEHFGLRSGRVYLAGTLSKAFGGHGGFVVGKRGLTERIRTEVGAYIGATPTPTPIAASTAKGIQILRNHPEMRNRLRQNAALLKAGMKRLGVPADDTPVPIVAWTLRSELEMRRVQKALRDRGIAIAYLKYVGAPPAGVLRITVFSTHAADDIRRLLEELAEVL
ncbi:MAG: pyridoxal phosphate-dependent aminotransferase family protein [Acidobacteriota bacterium]